MAIQQTPIDEFSISMVQAGDVTITAGTPKVVVVGTRGTRDANGNFAWADKVLLELYPDAPGEYPTDQETGEILPHVRLVPPDVLLDVRAALIAIEDFLQSEVSEPNEPQPRSVAQARHIYQGSDPRLQLGWRSDDGHNTRPGMGLPQVPRPQDRTPEIRGRKARP